MNDPPPEASKSDSAVPLRMRSRFPKAMPNVAISSGIARIRRLSGHFTDTMEPHGITSIPAPGSPQPHEHTGPLLRPPSATTPSSPLITQHHQQQPSTTQSPAKSNENDHFSRVSKSPAPSPTTIVHTTNTVVEAFTSSSHLASSPKPDISKFSALQRRPPLTPTTNNSTPSSPSMLTGAHNLLLLNHNSMSPLAHNNNSNSAIGGAGPTFKQYIINQIKQHQINSSPNTPNPDSSYKPQYSKEHIMNLIKHKALLKLNKIESEALRDRRKKYQRNSNIAQSIAETAANISNAKNDDTNSTDSFSSFTPPPIDRSKIRMRDLLYYSPRGNFMKKAVVDPSEIIIETILPPNAGTSSETASNLIKMPPPPPKVHVVVQSAPQLKLSADGRMVINEESLIIQREEDAEPVYDSTVVESEQNDNLSYNSYRKFHHTKKWSEKETAKFYKALSMIGTDFTMIQRLFVHRNRDEIKRKFKREEKINQALIDKILSKTTKMDLSVFIHTSSEDETPAKAAAKKAPSSDVTEKKLKYDRYKLKRTKKRTFVDSDEDEAKSSISAQVKSPGARHSLIEALTPTHSNHATVLLSSSSFEPPLLPSSSSPSQPPKKNTNKENKKVAATAATNDTPKVKKVKKLVSFQDEHQPPHAKNTREPSKTKQSLLKTTQSDNNTNFMDTINGVVASYCADLPQTPQAANENSLTQPLVIDEANTSDYIDTATALEEKLGAQLPVVVEANVVENKKVEQIVEELVEKEEKKGNDDEDEENEFELVLDMDTDEIIQIDNNCPTQCQKEADDAPKKDSDEDNEENVIFDLDNNTIVRNNVILSENEKKKVSPGTSPTKSQITITKRPKR